MKLFLPIIDNGGGSVKANWVVCMMTSFNGREIHIERISDSHADRACNRAASLFLASDCTDMLIIDTDILFSAKDIDRILAHDLPLVCGIYPKKSDETEACLGTFNYIPIPDENGLTEVRWAGRGFMRIRREVFEAMKEENSGPALRFHNYGEDFWDFFASGTVEGDMTFLEPGKREWVSEDILFCLRAKLAGFATVVDSQIALGHEGGKVFRFRPEQVSRVDDWRSIPGWFTEADAEAYRRIAALIPDNGKLAEVGTWMGRSLGAFVTFLRETGKHAAIHAIDTFKGTLSEGNAHSGIVAAHGGSVRPAFEANMKAMGVNGEMAVHESESVIAAKEFQDRSLDALFIDGDHAYEAVFNDMAAWIWKVKPGGIIAGHDYDYPGVARAVHQYIDPNRIETIGRCWLAKV